MSIVSDANKIEDIVCNLLEKCVNFRDAQKNGSEDTFEVFDFVLYELYTELNKIRRLI